MDFDIRKTQTAVPETARADSARQADMSVAERPMVIVHAIWNGERLHLWGETRAADAGRRRRTDVGAHVPNTDVLPLHPSAVPSEALRAELGNVLDVLLISGGAISELPLQFPTRGRRPVRSSAAIRLNVGGMDRPLPHGRGSVTGAADSQDQSHRNTGHGSQSSESGAEPATMALFRVPTLAFDPADAIDVLVTSLCPGGREPLLPAASLQYWSRAAWIVIELLGRQSFIPAVHQTGTDRYIGCWRPVVEDDETLGRLERLASSMPPVCRAVSGNGRDESSQALVESFMVRCLDAHVRRCLEGDELAHAILDAGRVRPSPQMRWLQSLVRGDGWIGGDIEERHRIHQTITEWLRRLQTGAESRTTRTCLRLDPPEGGQASWASPRGMADQPAAGVWTLRLLARSLSDPGSVADASQIMADKEGDFPRILKRPFARALPELRSDAARAARHFPPLGACADPAGPLECALTQVEAYSFLRDARPILEAEGFEIQTPFAAGDDGRRLRLWLEIRPEDDTESISRADMGLDSLVRYEWHVCVGDEELSVDELAALARSSTPLSLLGGRWMEVQPVEAETALRFLRNERGGTIPVREALRRLYVADDLPTGLPVAGLRSRGWVRALVGEGDDVEVMAPVETPPGFCGQLRPYQRRGLEWFLFLTARRLGACLADDMGLGKTIQLIALLLSERQDGIRPPPTLLVVPTSLAGNWRREIGRFAPALRVMIHHGSERPAGAEFTRRAAELDAVITTYGLVYRDFSQFASLRWGRVALDEAQNIKNPASKQARAVTALPCDQRVALTGTPVENRLSELWSIMEFLNPGYLGTATDFRRRFAVPVERYHDSDRAQRLKHLIRPFVLRRLKSDPRVQVDLPEKMEMKVYCHLTPEQAALYQRLVDEMLSAIDQAGGIQRRGLILAALVKLKQICNHPAQLLRDAGPLARRSGKCDRLVEMVDEVLAEGDRALIFTQFRRMGELLQRHLTACFGREVLFLHGGTTRSARDEIVRRFQDRGDAGPLLVLSLKAGGYGLNLTAAGHVFHFDRWWNPAVEDQATDRAYRIGQDRRVLVHKFICIGTLEERIDALLEEKRSLADRIIGTGEEWLTELSTAKLRQILMLSRDAVAEE